MGLLGVSLLILLIIFLLGVFTAGSFFASIPIFGDILALPFQALGFIPTQFWIGFVMLGLLAYFLSGNNNGGGGGGGKATGAALVGAGLGAASELLGGSDGSSGGSQESSNDRRNIGSLTRTRDDEYYEENDEFQNYLSNLSDLQDMAGDDSSSFDASKVHDETAKAQEGASEEEEDLKTDVRREGKEEEQVEELEEITEQIRREKKEIIQDIEEIMGPIKALNKRLEHGADILEVAQWAQDHQEKFARLNKDIQEIHKDYNDIQNKEKQREEILNKVEKEIEVDIQDDKEEMNLQEKLDELGTLLEKDLKIKGEGWFS
jgi:hypothetical protein